MPGEQVLQLQLKIAVENHRYKHTTHTRSLFELFERFVEDALRHIVFQGVSLISGSSLKATIRAVAFSSSVHDAPAATAVWKCLW